MSLDANGSFDPLQVVCEINGYLIPAVIDTGAQISVMSQACARRCKIYNNIDRRFSGNAVGVGSSSIIGRVNHLPIRIGPISFSKPISILESSRVEFLIGLDILKRFNCEINIGDNVIKFYHNQNVIRIPMLSSVGINPKFSNDISGQSIEYKEEMNDPFQVNSESDSFCDPISMEGV
jgi:DNA damage-inducible protein 1